MEKGKIKIRKMITHTNQVKDCRPDGALMYEATLAYLSPESAYLYDRRIIQDDGRCFIRINHATKYRKDGSIEWRQIYNDMGQIVGSEKGSKKNLQFKLNF